MTKTIAILFSISTGFTFSNIYVGMIGLDDIEFISKLSPFGIAVLFAALSLYLVVILDKRLRSAAKEKEELYRKMLKEKEEEIKDLKRNN